VRRAMSDASAVGPGVPSKLALLTAMAEADSQAGRLFQRVEELERQGDLHAEAEVYSQLLLSLQRHLALSIQHNAVYPDAVDLVPIAQRLVNAMLRQASTLQTLGERARSSELMTAALALSKQHLSPLRAADTERSTASLLTLDARYNQALSALASARDTFRAAGATLKYAHATLDLVDLLHWLGDLERAQVELGQVLAAVAPLVVGGLPTMQSVESATARAMEEITEGRGDGRAAEDAFELYEVYSLCDFYEGLICRDLGQYDEAERAFKRALDGLGALSPDEGTAIEAQLAIIKVRTARFADGLADLERLKPRLLASEMLRARLPSLLTSEAEAQLGLGQPGQALELIDEARAESGDRVDPDQLWKTEWIAGRILEALGRPDDALAAYMRGAAAVNGMRIAPLGYRLDSTFLRDKSAVFEAGIRLAARLGDARRCSELVEMVKSRMLTATLSIPRDDADPVAEQDGPSRRMDEISRELDSLEYSWFKGTIAADEVGLRRDRLLAERTDLLERIAYSDPRWRAITKPVPFDSDAVARSLAERDMAALSLYVLPDAIVSLLLADGTSQVASQP
jgi:tetratricopeptide (TPR) repeat protein